MSRIRTIIGIPAPGSYWSAHYRPDAVDDIVDAEPEDSAEPEDDVDYCEEAYCILSDGIEEALELLRAKDYSAAMKCLKDRQTEAEKLVSKCGEESKACRQLRR